MSSTAAIYIFPGVFLFVGLAFVVASVGIGRSRAKKRERCTAQTVGKVADMRKVSHSESDGTTSYSWHAVYTYYANGTNYEKFSSFGTSKPKFELGHSVVIFYDPGDPDSYYVEEENWGKLLKIFGVLGVLLIIAGAAAFFLIRRFT